jgi:hypothetical protein
MSTDPRRPRDPDPEPAAGVYGFADPEPPPPPPRPPTPVGELPSRPAADLGEELDLEADTAAKPAPGPRKRKRRRPERDADAPAPADDDPGYGPRSGEIGDRILNREEEEPAYPWWAVPAILVGVGGLIAAVPLIVMTVQQGAATGGLAALATFGGLVIEVLVLSAILTVVGVVLGIDYGPLPEAVLKLAAITAVVTGVLLCGVVAGGVVGTVIAGCVALVVGIGLFQMLFRLAVYETLFTLGGMMAVSFAVQFLVLGALLATKR